MTDPPPAPIERLDVLPLALPLLLLLAAFSLELSLVLRRCEGHLAYTLDDPYIHLALAEKIAGGHYGINWGEASSPASSVLWPFLLAPFSATSFAAAVPLVLGLLASIGALLAVESLGRAAGWSSWARTLAGGVAIPAFNLIGLAFTGMEHALQVALCVASVAGLARVSLGEAPGWLAAVLVLGPLVRYENLAFSVPAIAYLAWRGSRRAAIGSAAALVAALGGFSLFLLSRSLPALPTSVLKKARPGWIGLRLNLATPECWLLLTLGALLGFVVLSRERPARERGLALAGIASIGAHVVFGQFGWFHRYEVYAIAGSLTLAAFLFREAIARPAGLAAALVVVALASAPYVRAALDTPDAARNIYDQQLQMRRFALEVLHAPVAVNDLGAVSFGNDRYVLDLEGLGSLTALRMRRLKTDGLWIDALAEEHGVRFAMLYEKIFPELPKDWIPLADLWLSGRAVTPFDVRVTFFARGGAEAARVRPLLDAFRRTLPAGVRLESR